MANNQFINLEELSKTTQALLSKINEQSNLKVNKANVKSELNEGTKIGSIEGVDFYTPNMDLATVAYSGSYNDLSNKPSFATVATSGKYNDLTGKPSLATVATSGSYNDLSSKPLLPFIIIDAADSGSEIYPAHLSNGNDLSSFPMGHSGQNLWTYFYFYLTTDITLTKAQTSFSIEINDTTYNVIRYTRQGTPYVANSLDYSINLVKGIYLGKIGSEVNHYYLYIYENTQAYNSVTVSGHTVASNVPADAVFTDTVYDDTAISSRITTLENAGIPIAETDANVENMLDSFNLDYTTNSSSPNYAAGVNF